MIPDFYEYLVTLDKDRILSDSVAGASKFVDMKTSRQVDHNELLKIAMSSAFGMSIALLQAYHEWLQDQMI